MCVCAEEEHLQRHFNRVGRRRRRKKTHQSTQGLSGEWSLVARGQMQNSLHGNPGHDPSSPLLHALNSLPNYYIQLHVHVLVLTFVRLQRFKTIST